MITPPINIHSLVAGATAAITDTSVTTVIPAADAKKKIFVTSLTVTNSHASVGTVVQLKSGSTVLHTGYAAPGGGRVLPASRNPDPRGYRNGPDGCLSDHGL